MADEAWIRIDKCNKQLQDKEDALKKQIEDELAK